METASAQSGVARGDADRCGAVVGVHVEASIRVSLEACRDCRRRAQRPQYVPEARVDCGDPYMHRPMAYL